MKRYPIWAEASFIVSNIFLSFEVVDNQAYCP